MDSIPFASDEEYAIFPRYVYTFHKWLLSNQNKAEKTARNYVRQLVHLFEDDGKSISEMASGFYVELTKNSEKNKIGNNQRACAVRLLVEFMRQHTGGPLEDPGDTPLYHPKYRPKAPTVASAQPAADEPAEKKQRIDTDPQSENGQPVPVVASNGNNGAEEQADAARKPEANGQDRPGPALAAAAVAPAAAAAADPAAAPPAATATKGRSRRGKQEDPLAGLSLVERLHAQGKYEGAILIDKADGTQAPENGVYCLRKGNFHGKPAYEKMCVAGEESYFLYYVSPKRYWRICERLDTNRKEVAWISIDDVGPGSPSQWAEGLPWSVPDGKDKSVKDPNVRCRPLNERTEQDIDARLWAATTQDPAERAREARRARDKRREERIEKESQKLLKQAKKDKKSNKKDKAEKGRKEKAEKHLLNFNGVDAEMLSQVDQLSNEGKLAEAVLIMGRDPAKKNASVNGVYVQRDRTFHAANSYIKEGNGLPDRCLFFSSTKSAWKLSDKFDDSKLGFAFAKVDGKEKSPSEDLVWRVFGGKEEGYAKDHDVKCVPAADLHREVLKVAGLDNDSAQKNTSDEESDGEKPSSSSDEETGEAEDEKQSQGSSSSSEAEGKAPKREVTDSSHEQEPEGSPSMLTYAVPTTERVRAPKRGRVCAKMLVRSSFRCSCHFAPLGSCPGRG